MNFYKAFYGQREFGAVLAGQFWATSLMFVEEFKKYFNFCCTSA